MLAGFSMVPCEWVDVLVGVFVVAVAVSAVAAMGSIGLVVADALAIGAADCAAAVFAGSVPAVSTLVEIAGEVVATVGGPRKMKKPMPMTAIKIIPPMAARTAVPPDDVFACGVDAVKGLCVAKAAGAGVMPGLDARGGTLPYCCCGACP